MIARGLVILLVGTLSACGGSAISPSASRPEAGQSIAPSTVVSAPGSSEPTPSPTGDSLRIDTLAQVLVGGLNLRAQPSISSESLGHLRLDEPAYLVAGPVEGDGYVWYQLDAVRPVYECADDSLLVCGDWFGWAAAGTPDGDRWLAPLNPVCPTERTTESYLPLLPAERLACAGDDEWKLTAYIAEGGGRGCYPTWVTEPRWLFAQCNLFFPQPVERELDEDMRLQTFVHPDLGWCYPYPTGLTGCPFAGLTGSWVEMTGHLDDPAASTCEAKLPEDFYATSDSDSLPPPDPDQVVFACRLALVVTAVRATSPPST